VATISLDNPVVTLINVFTVEPEQQQRLVDVLVEATEEVMRHLPGYVSANIHRGLDGRHVANYAQWRRRQDFEAMLRNPLAQTHLQAAARLATFAPQLYEVVFSDGAPSTRTE
jgi:quinol monooxygenase YgiN